MPNRSKVHTQLMSAPGFKPELHQCEFSSSSDHAIIAHCHAATMSPHGHLLPVDRMPANRQGNCSHARYGMTPYYSHIGLAYLSLFELPRQCFLSLYIFCNQQYS